MKHRIHVNQHVIKRNQKTGEREAPLTCKSYRENRLGYEVEIIDREGQVIARVIYSPDKPLSCGARVWIETEAEVRIKSDPPE
mgnify:CR=1 FL=1